MVTNIRLPPLVHLSGKTRLHYYLNKAGRCGNNNYQRHDKSTAIGYRLLGLRQNDFRSIVKNKVGVDFVISVENKETLKKRSQHVFFITSKTRNGGALYWLSCANLGHLWDIRYSTYNLSHCLI